MLIASGVAYFYESIYIPGISILKVNLFPKVSMHYTSNIQTSSSDVSLR